MSVSHRPFILHALILFSALLVANAFAAEEGKSPAGVAAIARFSDVPTGTSLPAGWTHQTLPNVERANRFDLVSENGHSVLRVVSQQSASTLTFALRGDVVPTPWLSWRWKVSRAVDGSDFRSKAGDDYPARVYVLFDLPPERLSVGERLKIATAKIVYGTEIPAAALCYVWGSKQAAGESGWNPYTDRVRMLIVDSSTKHAGQWRQVSRNVADDFVAAFGEPVPPIAGIVVSADTDNTGETVETRFGDFKFEAQP